MVMYLLYAQANKFTSTDITAITLLLIYRRYR